jgi:hypothetical protein
MKLNLRAAISMEYGLTIASVLDSISFTPVVKASPPQYLSNHRTSMRPLSVPDHLRGRYW